MGFFGYVITGILILMVIGYANKNNWPSLKKWVSVVLVFLVCNFIYGDSLESDGKDYILDQLRDPSSAEFHSYTKSKAVRKLIKNEWNIKYDKDVDIIMLEVVATNGFGGKVRTKYAVFFKDGEPIDMMDASNLNKSSIRSTFGYLDVDYENL